jgi:hypothetical protein
MTTGEASGAAAARQSRLGNPIRLDLLGGDVPRARSR